MKKVARKINGFWCCKSFVVLSKLLVLKHIIWRGAGDRVSFFGDSLHYLNKLKSLKNIYVAEEFFVNVLIYHFFEIILSQTPS